MARARWRRPPSAMDPERWRRIKELFSSLLELAGRERGPPGSRPLAGDPALVAEVEEPARRPRRGGRASRARARSPPSPGCAASSRGAPRGSAIGPYRVLSELGRGGMGAVYLAVRDDGGFAQQVALKLIKRGMDTDEIVRRFVAERQILAVLSPIPTSPACSTAARPPTAAPTSSWSTSRDGRSPPTPPSAGSASRRGCALFLQASARAVQHAHQSLVVHRDLKPANILVDDDGRAQAARLRHRQAARSRRRSAGRPRSTGARAERPMTPDYASPEQRAGGAVTTATDVYGLGVLLYELLVGADPALGRAPAGRGMGARAPAAPAPVAGRRTPRRGGSPAGWPATSTPSSARRSSPIPSGATAPPPRSPRTSSAT